MHVWFGTTTLFVLAIIIYALHHDNELRASWWRRVVLLGLPLILLTYVTTPWKILPWKTPNQAASESNATAEPVAKKPVRIFVWNALLMNFNYATIAEVIREVDADIVAIVECNSELGKQLEPMREQYPFASWRPNWQSQGTIVMSRIADTSFELIELDKTQPNQAVVAHFKIHPNDSKPSRLMVLHPLSPRWPLRRIFTRNDQLTIAARWAGEHSDQPLIMMGDFNTSPWSPIFDDMLKLGQLHDSRNYRGYFASWPSVFYDFGIPIDHALVNQHIKVLDRRVLQEAYGSDHRGVILEIQ